MRLFEAKKYHALARISLELAEVAKKRDIQNQLIELSRIWTQAALKNEKKSVRTGSFRR